MDIYLFVFTIFENIIKLVRAVNNVCDICHIHRAYLKKEYVVNFIGLLN